jgi:hypothetical protein
MENCAQDKSNGRRTTQSTEIKSPSNHVNEMRIVGRKRP